MSDIPLTVRGMNAPDDDDLDGCDSVIASDEYDDDDTAALRPLFPDGDPSTEPEWRELFSGA